MKGEISASLARFVASSRWDDLPPSVKREAKRALLNISGCIIAGLRLNQFEFDDRAVVLGAAANALDFDDTHLPTVIHPGPPVGAALFALAEKWDFSGRELLHAYVLGVEAACRIGNIVSPGHYQHGWHITSTCGVFGVAAVAFLVSIAFVRPLVERPGSRTGTLAMATVEDAER